MKKNNLYLVATFVLCIAFSVLNFKLNAQKDIMLEKGQKKYINKRVIRPGQIRISQAGVQAKIEDALKKEFVVEKDGKYFDLRFDNGRSIIPEDNALPVVLIKCDGDDWLVLLDGHHDYMSNKSVGGTTVYIEVKDDLREIPSNKIWNVLQEKNYIYVKNLEEKEVIPLPETFDTLENDPYRYFVKLAMWECKTPETTFDQSKPGTENLKYPLAVKWKDKKFNPNTIEKFGATYVLNPPYIEFIVADMLYKHATHYGFNYKDGDEKDAKLFQNQVEIARHILTNHPVEGFNFIPSKIESKQVNNGNICGYIYFGLSTRVKK